MGYDKNISPVPLTHGRIKTTFEGLTKQVKLFDHEFVEDLPPETAWAAKQVGDQFIEFGIESKILPIWDLEYNLSATNGVIFDLGREYQNKREYFADPQNLHHVMRYCELVAEGGQEFTPLVKVSGKEEYLKFTKIQSNDQRCFEIFPVHETTLQMMYNQYFNKQLYKHCDKMFIKVGTSFQAGGFHRLFDLPPEEEDWIHFMGDVSKFDKNFAAKLRNQCKLIRIRCYKGPHPEQFKRSMEHIYRNENQTYFMMPWGQIILKDQGMNSGSVNTTPDNSIAHLIVLYAYIYHHRDLIYDRLGIRIESWRDIEKVLKACIYADDHTGRIHRSLEELAAFETREGWYRRYGFTLKKEDDKVTDSPVGLTFLGAEIVKHGCYYAPKYNLSRIWSAIVHTHRKRIDPKTEMSRLLSLLVLSTFNGKTEFDRIRSYVIMFRDYLNEFYPTWIHASNKKAHDNAKVDLDFVAFDLEPKYHHFFIPTYEWSVGFWLGLECTPGVAPEASGHKRTSCMNFKFHGNYCGPGWSDGKYQDSVESTTPGIDLLDELCRDHDRSYANATDEDDLIRADQDFFWNLPYSLKGTTAKIGIGAQLLYRMAKRGRGNKGGGSSAKLRKEVKQLVKATKREVKLGKGFKRNLAAVRRGRTRRNRNGSRGARAAPLAINPRSSRTFFQHVGPAGPNRARFRGSMYLGQISSGASGFTAGQVISTWELAPESLPRSRLTLEAACWEVFQFQRTRLRYTPICPATTSGELIAYYDRDPNDTPVGGSAGLVNAKNNQFHVNTTVWTGTSLTVPNLDRQIFFSGRNTSSTAEDKLYAQGHFVLMAGSNIDADIALGHLELDYEIDFKFAHVDPVSTLYNAAAYSSSGGMDENDFFGNGFTMEAGGSIQVTVVNTKDPGWAALDTSALTAGTYMFLFDWTLNTPLADPYNALVAGEQPKIHAKNGLTATCMWTSFNTPTSINNFDGVQQLWSITITDANSWFSLYSISTSKFDALTSKLKIWRAAIAPQVASKPVSVAQVDDLIREKVEKLLLEKLTALGFGNSNDNNQEDEQPKQVAPRVQTPLNKLARK